MTDGRITRGVLGVAGDGDPKGRMTRVAIEVLASTEVYVPPEKNPSFFMHLLPRAEAWNLTISKQLRKFFEALVAVKDDAVEFLDLIWFDMFPATTRELTAWEQSFGLFRLDLTEAERRERLDGLWKATGGQSPRYIQDTMQGAGFDVYVHDWWELPATDPPVARNPYTALGASVLGCGDPLMMCGEPIAQCGATTVYNGYMLVNKIYTTQTQLTCLCGEALMQCGEPLANCNENTGVIFNRVDYPIPTDPNQWPYIIYVGGATFPDPANIGSSRMDEFEDLLLKICPAHLWIGVLVDFTGVIIEDETGFNVVEDETGFQLVEVL
jgi:hypothetical protein